jgi:hypothetical protein
MPNIAGQQTVLLKMSKLPPHPCPNEYRRLYPHGDWYHEGTLVNFSDGFRCYRGLVRGDGLLLTRRGESYRDHRTSTSSPHCPGILLCYGAAVGCSPRELADFRGCHHLHPNTGRKFIGSVFEGRNFKWLVSIRLINVFDPIS